jgi:hypothetical protein
LCGYTCMLPLKALSVCTCSSLRALSFVSILIHKGLVHIPESLACQFFNYWRVQTLNHENIEPFTCFKFREGGPQGGAHKPRDGEHTHTDRVSFVCLFVCLLLMFRGRSGRRVESYFKFVGTRYYSSYNCAENHPHHQVIIIVLAIFTLQLLKH